MSTPASGGGLGWPIEYLESLAGSEQKMCSFDHYFTIHFLYIRFLYLWSMAVGREFDCLALLNRRIQPMGFNLTPDQLEELACLWYDVLGQQAQLEDNLHRTLEELQKMGVQTAILSNTFLPGIALDRHLKSFRFDGVFFRFAFILPIPLSASPIVVSILSV